MIGWLIDIALTATGIKPALEGAELVVRLAFVVAIIVVAALVLGVDPLAVVETAKSALQDWLLSGVV